MSDYWIGIDLGGTRFKAICLEPSGVLIDQVSRPLGSLDQKLGWAEAIREQVAGWVEKRGVPRALGVAAPGLADRENRMIVHMPGRLSGLERLNWGHFLGIGREAPVLNDAHAALLGEQWRGAAKGEQNVVLLTLGTGVGGAILSEGRLLQGAIGRAGHLGHISLDPNGARDIVGTPGSLEEAIGEATLGRRSRGAFSSTKELVAAHQRGDPEATKIWMASLKALAAGVVSVINMMDPDLVLIGGGISAAGDALFHPLSEFMDAMEWRPGGRSVKIRRAELGEMAGAYGAARFAGDGAKFS